MKLISLVSSGIDSPVATYLMAKHADVIILLHADNRPLTDDREIQKFNTLAKHLKKISPCKIQAYLIAHGNALQNYQQSCEKRFTCVFCKRMIVRYAEKLAKQKGAPALVMGDSLGQVASQTLQNISVVEQATSLPILRPLVGCDKTEVITIAKEIGTYELSIQKSSECLAVPSKPATQSHLERILAEEQKIPVQEMIDDAVATIQKISL